MKKKIDSIILIFLSILLMASSILVNNTNKYYLYVKIFIYVLLVLYLFIKIIQKKPVQIIKNKLDIFVMLLALSTLIPLIFNTYISLQDTVLTILKYTCAFSIYILFREIIQRGTIQEKTIINILIILSVIIVVIGLDNITTQNLTSILKRIGISNSINGENRLISVVGYANTLAAYIASIIFLNIKEYICENKREIKALYKTLTTIFITAIFLTYSKAVIVLLPIAMLVYILIIKDKSKRREVIQNILVSFAVSLILIFIYENLVGKSQYLLLWIIFTIVLIINYLTNLILEKIQIKTIPIKKIIIILIITILCFITYLIICLNIYDEYDVFIENVRDSYDAKIIDNISGNTPYVFEFDIDAKAPKDLEETYTINIIERDSKNQEINETNIKFGTYNGKKKIELVTNEQTKEVKIEFKSQFEYSQKSLVIRSLTINNKIVPLKYKYLPTKLIEKIKNININYKTSQERIEMIKDALKLSTQNLLTGMGGDAWKYKYQEVQNYSYTANTLHSYPAKIILEFGLLGIISYIGIAIITIKLAINFIKNKDIRNISILFALMIICIHSIIDIDMECMHILIYIFGLMGILSNELKGKENLNKVLNIIMNIIVIIISISSIYFSINTSSYDKYEVVVNSVRQKNGLVENSQKYQEANNKIAQSYEYLLKYERYNYIETYFDILYYYMDSDVENKLEILEKYYEKIAKYENKEKNNVTSILMKDMEIYNFIHTIKEKEDSKYDEIEEKYIDIVLKEYQETKKQLEECLKKQHKEVGEYTEQLENMYNNLCEIKKKINTVKSDIF